MASLFRSRYCAAGTRSSTPSRIRFTPSDIRSRPRSRDSTLITRAPRSASSMVQNGMAMTWPRSRTVTSSSACSIPRLPADRVARPTRVRAGRQDATLSVDGDRAHSAGLPGPVWPRHDLVTLVRERTAHLGREATLDAQLVGLVGMRLERSWIAVGGEPRHLDG